MSLSEKLQEKIDLTLGVKNQNVAVSKTLRELQQKRTDQIKNLKEVIQKYVGNVSESYYNDIEKTIGFMRDNHILSEIKSKGFNPKLTVPKSIEPCIQNGLESGNIPVPIYELKDIVTESNKPIEEMYHQDCAKMTNAIIESIVDHVVGLPQSEWERVATEEAKSLFDEITSGFYAEVERYEDEINSILDDVIGNERKKIEETKKTIAQLQDNIQSFENNADA